MGNESRRRCFVIDCGGWATHVYSHHLKSGHTNRVFLCSAHNEDFKKEGDDFFKNRCVGILNVNRKLPLDGSDAIENGEIDAE